MPRTWVPRRVPRLEPTRIGAGVPPARPPPQAPRWANRLHGVGSHRPEHRGGGVRRVIRACVGVSRRSRSDRPRRSRKIRPSRRRSRLRARNRPRLGAGGRGARGSRAARAGRPRERAGRNWNQIVRRDAPWRPRRALPSLSMDSIRVRRSTRPSSCWFCRAPCAPGKPLVGKGAGRDSGLHPCRGAEAPAGPRSGRNSSIQGGSSGLPSEAANLAWVNWIRRPGAPPRKIDVGATIAAPLFGSGAAATLKIRSRRSSTGRVGRSTSQDSLSAARSRTRSPDFSTIHARGAPEASPSAPGARPGRSGAPGPGEGRDRQPGGPIGRTALTRTERNGKAPVREADRGRSIERAGRATAPGSPWAPRRRSCC